MIVLHVIERLSRGGATRALIALAKYSARQGDFRHVAASLLPPEAWAVGEAAAAGLKIMGPMDDRQLDQEIVQADIVQVHFWNNPRLYEALDRDWPPSRVVCWCHVAGDRPAQILTPVLVGFPDVFMGTAPPTADLPVVRRAPAEVVTGTILASPDFARLGDFEPRRRAGFTVGYLGAVDFVKMHPDFAAMHAAIGVPGLRVVVCGSGADLPVLARQAGQLGCADRFEFRGQVEEIGSALAEFDVFGYPLSPETCATAELALQEAMFAGIPPVVLAGAGPAQMVRSGETGLVASNAEDYVQAIERLHRDPGLRSRLGRAAARFARQAFGAEKTADSFHGVYRQMVTAPKRVRRLGTRPPVSAGARDSGAGRFVRSLGSGPQFEASLRADDPSSHPATVLAAERLIAASPPLLVDGGAGGVLHYRLHYPTDPHLRLWAGLVLQQRGRHALAAVEFSRAIALGLDRPRVRRYLEAATAQAGGGPGPAREARADPGRPAPGNHGPPPWMVGRGGLRAAWEQLGERPSAIAYVGNSVTAQREGFRPVLHRWICDSSAHEHRAINAGFGGVGSLGCAFLLEELVLGHRPRLCFIECTTGDWGGRTPAAEIGPVVEGLVRRLRGIGCSVCLLHLLNRKHPPQPEDTVLAAYERVADHYGIPSLHLAPLLRQEILSDPLAAQMLFRDGVHISPVGAFLVATLVGEALAAAGALPPRSAGLPAPLYPKNYEFTEIVSPHESMLDDGREAKWGSFRLFRRYLEVETGRELTLHLDRGDLAGLLVVLGPDTGALTVLVDGRAQNYPLRDKWCYYDRMHALALAAPIPMGKSITLRAEDEPAAEAPAAGRGNSHPRRLRLAGFLIRKPSSCSLPSA